jgi:hypothetical protein
MCEGGGGHNSERLVSLKPELRPEILALAGRRNVFVADADPPCWAIGLPNICRQRFNLESSIWRTRQDLNLQQRDPKSRTLSS